MNTHSWTHRSAIVASLTWAIVGGCWALPATAHEPSTVLVEQSADGFRLLKDGEPYRVQGAGGDGSLKLLAGVGGNSVRTWGTDNLEERLDEAHKLGLTVAVGIWLGHERHGFNYNDADQVAEQQEKVRQVIERFKDHPAVLLWGLGNEMEGYERGDNAAIWSAINNLSTLVHQIDPYHPTMTVVAEIGGDRVKNIHRLCPDLDIVGINSYAGAASLPKRYREAGGTKPYIVTECGPPGAWETEKTPWGASLEPSSTEKAEQYRQTWQATAIDDAALCLGMYAFTWGHKQEATATWFGMLLPDGSRLGGVDALSRQWTGKPLRNSCPTIESLKLVGPAQVDPGQTVVARLSAADPDGDKLQVRWVLQSDPVALGVGGDAEDVPPTHPKSIIESDLQGAKVRLPAGGAYRLFAYLSDGHDGAAVANIPLRASGEAPITPARQAELPLVLYDDGSDKQLPFAPSGWMGNAKGMKVDLKHAGNPHDGQTCIRIDYKESEGWAGVVWQSPADDWGDRPGGWNLTGAKQLSFWARGEKGGEVVKFEFGLLGKDKRFSDSGSGKTGDQTLTTEWRQHTIDLKGVDLTRIKTGFAWVLEAKGQPVTFYLDGIEFE
ncbi:MAG: glycoside hydrolase family 2 TIM barrel-domain containing protein [Pirellulales bacterium]